MLKVTKTETRKASKAKASKARAKASKARANGKALKAKGKASKAKGKASKGNGNASKPSKASRRGGGKALSDFGNSAKLRVLNAKEIPSRRACFKTGQTVSANLAAQKTAGFRGRRKFIRAQIAQGRISLN